MLIGDIIGTAGKSGVVGLAQARRHGWRRRGLLERQRHAEHTLPEIDRSLPFGPTSDG